jgi:ankyrin repeat protein
MATLLDAIAAGDLDQVRALLTADPSLASVRGTDGISAILRCVYEGRIDLAEAVLAARPTLDLFDAAGLGDISVLASLLATGADVNAYSGDGFTALHLAAFFDAPYAAALLLRAGAGPEAVADNPTQVRPLHSALAGRSVSVASILLSMGVDPDPIQQGGFTPLMAAAQHGDIELTDLLLACGADSSRASDDGRTIADIAAAAGHDKLVARLRGGA